VSSDAPLYAAIALGTALASLPDIDFEEIDIVTF
jgi:hypothetical protein